MSSVTTLKGYNFEALGFGVDLGFVYEWRPDWEEYKEQPVGQ